LIRLAEEMSYTQSDADCETARGHWAIEAFLLMAMALVALAVGVGLYLQLAASLWISAGATLAIYLVLVSAHVLIRRAETISMLQRQIGRLEREIARMRGTSGARPAESAPDASLSALKRGPVDAAGGTPSGALRPAPRSASRPAPKGAAEPTLPDPAARSGPFAPALPSAPPRGGIIPTRPHPAGDAASAAGSPPSVKSESTASATAAAAPPRPAHSGEAGPGPETGRPEASGIAADVDAINGIIQRLAAEMEALPDGAVSTAEGNGGSEVMARGPDLGTGESGLAVSVEGLRTAAASMRRTEAEALKVPGMAPLRPANPLPGQAAPPPIGAGHGRISDLAEAITAQRFDLFLEPIVDLAERRVRHHEYSVRLRTRQGESLGASDYVSVARGTGLLPLLDTLRITRLARICALKLDQGQSGLLFCQVSGESLTSSDFLTRLGEICPPRSPLVRRFALAFSQADVRQFTPPQWTAVARLADAGMTLAVDDVTALEMKLSTLRAGGFSHLRIDAGRLLDGLPGRQGPTPAGDLRRSIVEADLSLVATGISSEGQLAELQKLGVTLGSGPLLGAPRAIMLERPVAGGGVAA
jgi:EAL domain-containing protein (putative c-di-GMP-specific phosphodiesterase class I)